MDNGFVTADLHRPVLSIRYLLRVVSTGWCFAFFGLGGLVLSVFVLPVCRFWPGTESQRMRRVRMAVHYTFRYFLWQMDVLGCNHVDIEGRKRLAASRGELVIANHPSLIDIVILIACIPNACCIVKQALWRNPFLGGVVRWSGYISNSDPQQLIEQCKEVLDNGFSIVVFPEGTRTVDSKSLKFQRGAANIAVRCEVDILPVTITVNPPTLRKGEPWYQIPARKPVFRVATHEPMNIDNIVSQQDEPSLTTRQLNRYLHHYYQELLAKNP